MRRDLTYAIRMLGKNPGVTVISVVALMLGIGLTTTMFSIVYGALYRGLPFDEPQQIMHLERNNLSQDITSMEVTVHDYYDWREQQTVFTDLAAFYSGTVNLAGGEGRPERFDGAFMTANAFRVLGVGALRGRTFQEGDDRPGAAPVAVIGYALWQNRFNGDPDVVGQTARINGRQTTVVGVMPEHFLFPLQQQIWLPMTQDPLAIPRGEGLTLEVFGRLKPDVSIDQANVAMNTIAGRLADEYPETNEGVGVVIKPYTEEFIGEEPAAMLYTMLAAVFLVLLIACANVANLLLARAAVRAKEVAVRSALGATRWRVVMQFLIETFVVAAAGAVLGLAVAWIALRLFNNAIAPTDPPFWIDIRLDWIALTFAVGLAVLATLLAGVLPALRASGAGVNEILKDESRGTSSLRIGKLSKGLVVAEIALSCGLLVAAGLMIKSVVQLGNVDYGFTADQVLTARVGLFEEDYPTEDARLAFFEELQARLEAVPGVRAATIGTSLPALQMDGTRFGIEGKTYQADRDYPDAALAVITPGYFATFGKGVLQGRDFTAQDRRESVPVAIVNETFARKFFPGESALGRRIRMGDSDSEDPWRTIVGVVPDLLMNGIEDEEPEGFYVPLAQQDRRFAFLAVHAAGAPYALTSTVRDAVNAIDRDLPIYWVNTITDAVAERTWFYRVFGALFMVFGGAALFLGAVGLYAVMAFSVSRRTQEIGIRMALGAQARDVMRLILRQGAWELGIGLTLGLVVAALLSQGLEIVLFNVEPRDPVMFGLITVVLLAAGMLASWVPARRATHVDPVVALRYE